MRYSVLKYFNYLPMTEHQRISVVIDVGNKDSHKLSFSHIQFVEPNLFVILYAGKLSLPPLKHCVCVCVYLAIAQRRPDDDIHRLIDSTAGDTLGWRQLKCLSGIRDQKPLRQSPES